MKSAEIFPFADLHMGDRNCDYALIKKRIEHVQQTPNAYAILDGDLINDASKTSVSDSYLEQLTPTEQIKKAVEVFSPIKDKILCINEGNHERRAHNKEGIDITELIARELGVEDRYSATSSVIFLRLGTLAERKAQDRQVSYSIFCVHGSGGGRKEGAKIVRLADMASIVDADIFVHAHTHLPAILKEGFFRIDTANSTIAKVDKLFVNTAAYLDYGDYSEQFEFKPSSKDTPVIYLDGTRKFMTATL